VTVSDTVTVTVTVTMTVTVTLTVTVESLKCAERGHIRIPIYTRTFIIAYTHKHIPIHTPTCIHAYTHEETHKHTGPCSRQILAQLPGVATRQRRDQKFHHIRADTGPLGTSNGR